jgi:hypothetical protein
MALRINGKTYKREELHFSGGLAYLAKDVSDADFPAFALNEREDGSLCAVEEVPDDTPSSSIPSYPPKEKVNMDDNTPFGVLANELGTAGEKMNDLAALFRSEHFKTNGDARGYARDAVKVLNGLASRIIAAVDGVSEVDPGDLMSGRTEPSEPVDFESVGTVEL